MSSFVIRPRVSLSLGGGDSVVRSRMGVLTLCHRAALITALDGAACVGSGGDASSRRSRRISLARRRISATSCRTELGQRWRGILLLLGGGATL